MFGLGNKKLSTESYKGVRDFYPEDQALQNYIFGLMKKTVESWGYQEFNASILEPLELYKSKTSEEIVNEQIYFFTDRGGREVALRPEMTPTAARMVAARLQELPVPIRWYAIPNVFRYEKPQRGRLREHWQLNADLFGVSSAEADAEVISVAFDIMKNFGAAVKDFKIKINSRELLDDIFQELKVGDEDKQMIFRLLDKKDKIGDDKFRESLETLVGKEKTAKMMEDLYYGEGLLASMAQQSSAKRLNEVMEILRNRGITNLEFTATMTRGFDYYTGIVFEVFDTDAENPRALFGGGRYDNLVEAFAGQPVPAFGFGMGDVTIKDFMETHKLLPEISSPVRLYICMTPETVVSEVYDLAAVLRNGGLNVAVDISGKKLPDQLKSLDKRKIPFVMIVGPDELKNQTFTVRNTETREEKSGDINDIVAFLKNVL